MNVIQGEQSVSVKINCDLCEKTFDEKHHLAAHMKEHTTDNIFNNGRKFKFTLNEKKAKAKLLKGAIRGNHLEVETKSTCVNMRFSNGAYHELVLPLLRQWNNQVGRTVEVLGCEFKIVESNSGTDISENHIDTKLALLFNGNRIVMHLYNGTQNLMVQGKFFEDFALKHLYPFFTKKIEESFDIIEKVNNNMRKMLGEGKISSKQKKNVKPFQCQYCKIKPTTFIGVVLTFI